MMSFRILSWTGKVEEHFPRHVKGLELRKNSRRTSEKLIGGPAEAKEPQKRHVQGSDGRNRRVAGRRQASLEEEARRRKVAHAPSRADRKTRVDGAWMVFWLRWFGKNWRSPPGAHCGVEKNRRRKSSPEKFAGKVAGGKCFLTTIRPNGKRFLPWL